jgi:tetratricopeptide (TPR) repeat protein
VNQPEAAIHHYTDALKLLAVQSDGMAQVWAHPLQANLLLARAEGYRITKQFDNSEADYLAAANLIPDDPLIPFYRGLIALAWGDEATAINLSQTAWQMANPRLQDEMRQELMSNPGYLALVNALKIDQNDPS